MAECGYCQAGQIMSGADLLRTNPSSFDLQIAAAMSVNICRCGTNLRIKTAIKAEIKLLYEHLSQNSNYKKWKKLKQHIAGEHF